MRLMKKILLTTSIILAITGCSTNNVSIKSSPKVTPVDKVSSLADRTAIALEWNLVNNPQIKGYIIQRSEDLKHYQTVKQIENRFITHWTDTNLKPNRFYFYKVSTYNKDGIPSLAKFIKTKTLDKIEPVPFIANAFLKAKGKIKIIFRPHPNERVVGYYIQRFNDSNGKWETIQTLKPRLRAEFIDTDLVDGKVYQYRIIAFSYDGIQSLPSKVITAKTLEKPSVILQVTASNNLPNKIKVEWNKLPDAKQYKIYSSSINGYFTLLGVTHKNFFIDKLDKSGVTKYYKVTAVDKYGIESMMPENPVMGSTLSLPATPVVSIMRGIQSVKFILSSPDGRAVKYLIKKDDGTKIVKIHNVKNGFVDKNIKSDITYKYEIYSVDSHNLLSEPAKVEVTF